jgi:hypothetical protein
MRNVEIEVRVPGPRLPVVLRELVDRLCAGDWERRSTKDGSRFYYVVGAESAGATSGAVNESWVSEFPAEKPTRDPKQPSPLAEWHVRSQVAGKHPNYLERARRRLERAGVESQAIDRFLAGKGNIQEFFEGRFGQSEKDWETLNEFLKAYRISKSAEPPMELDDEEMNEIEIAREKMYLQELCSKFERMVDRGSQLEAASFSDPQLEEASRCLLYEFYRAAILLSACAVESTLKDSTGKKWFNTYDELVDTAWWAGKLGPDEKHLAGPAKTIFKKRTDVVHHNWSPEEDDAGEILGVAKEVIEYLRSQPR